MQSQATITPQRKTIANSKLLARFLSGQAVAAQQGNAVELNGADQSLSYSGTAFNIGTGDVTFACCIRLDSIPADSSHQASIFHAGSVGNFQQFFWVWITNTSKLSIAFNDGSSSYTIGSSSGWTPVVGQWYTIIAKIDRDGQYSCKINNANQNLGSIGGRTGNVNPGALSIGWRADSSQASYNRFDGRITGACMVKRLTTDAEDTWLHNGGKWRAWSEFGVVGTDGAALTTAVIPGFYAFENASNLGTDSTSNATSLTNNGGATQAAGLYGTSLYVSQWPDATGKSHDLIQSTRSLRPTFTANAVNGRPLIEFASSEMSHVFGSALSQPYTIALVGKMTAAGTIFDSTTGGAAKLSRGTSRFSGSAGTVLDGVSSDADLHTYMLVVDGDDSVLLVDGIEQWGPAGAGTMAGLLVGRDSASASPGTGGIVELDVWGRRLSPAERDRYGRQLASSYGLQYGKMRAVLSSSGEIVKVRIPWDATNDYVFGMNVGANGPTGESDPIYQRHNVNFVIAGLIAATTTDSSIPANPTVTLHGETDDCAPFNYNNGFMAGNHGYARLQVATATGHGKTEADIGSEWIDTLSVKWYIVRIVDANTLWLLSEPQSVYWDMVTTVNGGTLNHSQGAAHTTAITVFSQVSGQMHRSQAYSRKAIYRNGSQPLTVDGTYLCDFVDVAYDYTVKDVASQLARIVANRGSKVPLVAEDVDDSLAFTQVYRLQPNGAVTVTMEVATRKPIRLDMFGALQSSAPDAPAGGTRHQYANKTGAVSGYDFEAIADVTALATTVTLPKANWTDAAKPPDVYIQLSKTSGGAKYFGKAFGYDIEHGNAAPAVRAAAIGYAGYIGSSKKMYPTALSYPSQTFASNLVPVNTTWKFRIYRCPLNYGKYPTPTAVCWCDCAGVTKVTLVFHTNYSGYVSLPPSFEGKSIRVVDSHANVTVNNVSVTKQGVSVTITGGYGYVTLALA